MKKYFRFIATFARIIPPGQFAPVTFWRHSENKYLYLCMSKTHIKTDERGTGEEKFLEVFPKAIRISQIEFDLIIYFYPDIEVITVADDNIFSSIIQDNEFVPDNDGAYAEDEHEESEDKKLIDDAFKRGDIPETTFPYPND